MYCVGIEKHGKVSKEGATIYAYEVDGKGNSLTDFDDPNSEFVCYGVHFNRAKLLRRLKVQEFKMNACSRQVRVHSEAKTSMQHPSLVCILWTMCLLWNHPLCSPLSCLNPYFGV